MKLNVNKGLLVEVVSARVPFTCKEMSYVYGDKEINFSGFFVFFLPVLHELLFGEIFIVLYDCSNNMAGVGRIRLKRFLTESEEAFWPEDEAVEILKPSYLKKADSYDRDLEILGVLKCRFRILKGENSKEPACQPLEKSQGLASIFLEKETEEVFRIAYNIFRETQKGTLICRVRWAFGLVSADSYFRGCYDQCSALVCESGGCESTFCRSDYKRLSRAEICEGIDCLYYSAAAFANSFLTWRLEKRESRSEIKCARRRAILEKLRIKDSDLFMDYPGDRHSLAFIAFFDRGQAVVSFKGTSCGSEALHDLNCDYVEFLDGYTHRGIKKLAEKFLKEKWPSIIKEIKARGLSRILFTGHSLGAGAAILTYLILQNENLEKEFCMRVVGFGCPPILSENLAKRKFDNLIIYNYGCDIVSRLSLGSVLDLKYICISITSLQDLLTSREMIAAKIMEIRKYLNESQMYPKLYSPGRLIHIKAFSSDDREEYLFREVNYMFFQDLMLCKRAPFDHIIHKTLTAFQSALKLLDE